MSSILIPNLLRLSGIEGNVFCLVHGELWSFFNLDKFISLCFKLLLFCTWYLSGDGVSSAVY